VAIKECGETVRALIAKGHLTTMADAIGEMCDYIEVVYSAISRRPHPSQVPQTDEERDFEALGGPDDEHHPVDR
jgi:hypothetical protein